MYRKMNFHPLEREYEGWIVREIEDYFSALEIRTMVHAVGYEKTFAADEFVKANDKVFALQFKRPELETGSGLTYWQIQTKTNQFRRVLQEPIIFYALPTFLNRELARVSLNHVLFWRPDFKDGELLCSSCDEDGAIDRLYKPKDRLRQDEVDCFGSMKARLEAPVLEQSVARKSSDRGVQGTSSQGATSNFGKQRAVRWGRFVEEFFDCSVGLRTNSPDVANKLKKIIEAVERVEDGKEVVTVIFGVKRKKNGKSIFT